MKINNVPLKKNISYYTQKDRENILKNIERYDWAKKEKDRIVSLANEICELSYEYLWSLLPSQDMPRSTYFRNNKGCINCGYLTAYYAVDRSKGAWKCVCPNCKTVFPTNDFESYYKSSLDEDGKFVPGKGDKKYLVNTLYPEKGENWGVDDGFGFKSENGEAYPFAAYLAFQRWGIYVARELLNALCKAYMYTGIQKYADAAIILLDRAADLYPDMDIVEYTPERGLYLAHGGGGQGKISGCIEECVYIIPYLESYDYIFPAFSSMSKVAQEFIYSRSNGKKTCYTDIMCNIESGILLQILPAVKTGKIRGNNGYHQTTLGIAGVVLDHKELTKELLDFVFKSGVVATKKIEGGNVSELLIKDVDRNGFGNEASPDYNIGWVSCFIPLAKILDNYKITGTDISYDLFEHKKFKKMFMASTKFIISGKYSPNVGDAYSAGNPKTTLGLPICVEAFKKYRSDIFAISAYVASGRDFNKFPKDIKDDDPEEYIDEIKRIVSEKSELQMTSEDLTGYGMAILQNTEKGKNDTALTLYYGRTIGHAHADALNLGMYSFGLNLSPDLGTPEHKDAYDMMRRFFVHHTVSHNTVIVGKNKQRGAWSGRSTHFDTGDFVKLTSVDAPESYPEVTKYRRTCALIKYDDNVSYGVDFFTVKGGKEYTYSFHAAESPSYETCGLSLTKQTDEYGEYIGTLLSPDIEWGKVNDESGLQYLTKIRYDNSPDKYFTVDWSLKDTWNTASSEDVHLKLHMLGQNDKVTLAVGTPPRNKPGNPSELEYVLAYKEAEENIPVTFTAVLEPYDKNCGYIGSVACGTAVSVKDNKADDSVKVLNVSFKNGRRDIIIYNDSDDISKEYIIDGKYSFNGFFAVISIEADGRKTVYVNDSSKILDREVSPCICGKIVSFTKELTDKNYVTIKFTDECGIECEDLAGRYIYVQNDSVKNPSYKIVSAEKTGELYKLYTDDITFICGYIDPQDKEKGFVYDIAENDDLVIPLSFVFET